MIRIHSIEDTGSRAPGPYRLRQLGRNNLHQVQIVFGSRDRNCAGSGICSAKELQSQGVPVTRGCKGGNTATALVRIRGQHLVFTFPSLCPRLIQQYFYEDIFLMECDACMELWVGEKWVVYALPKGNYPVSRCKNGLVVKIPTSAGNRKTYSSVEI